MEFIIFIYLYKGSIKIKFTIRIFLYMKPQIKIIYDQFLDDFLNYFLFKDIFLLEIFRMMRKKNINTQNKN